MSDENNDDLTQLLLRVVEASEETNKLLPQVKQAFSLADRAGDIIRDTRRNEEEERAKIKHLEKTSYNLHVLTSQLEEAKKMKRLTIAVFVLFFVIGAGFLTNEIIRFIDPYIANMMDAETCEKYEGYAGEKEGRYFCVFWEEE